MSDEQKKKRTFRKYTYRGIDIDELMDMPQKQFVELLDARGRRKMLRGLGYKEKSLIAKLVKAKKAVTQAGQKPNVVKTHLRNMIVVPDMVGSIVGVYNGKAFSAVEIRPDMIGQYLAEFSISYRPVRHGRPGVGATNSSKFVSLK
ncbi:hypothetical protein RCL1_004989 [Eukaryota sp. TZLM3-RCL]